MSSGVIVSKAEEFTERYELIRVEKVAATRNLVKEALAAGIGVTIVCRKKSEAVEVVGFYRGVVAVSPLDQTPQGSLRIDYQDLCHEDLE
jgi:hypothetical protein